jgi:hypothetical protein
MLPFYSHAPHAFNFKLGLFGVILVILDALRKSVKKIRLENDFLLPSVELDPILSLGSFRKSTFQEKEAKLKMLKMGNN